VDRSIVSKVGEEQQRLIRIRKEVEDGDLLC
jgi:hypothetical protein